jgi:hypothetical protein
MLYSEHYICYNNKHNINIEKKFVTWINIVENKVFEKLKLRLLDIPDEDYMFYYEQKHDPIKISNYVINQYLN